MKLTRIISVILTAVMLLSVPLSVSAFFHGHRLPDDLYFSEDFTDTARIQRRFIMSNWYLSEDGGVYGHADAKAIQTFISDSDWTGFLEEPSYAYLDYDMTVTLAVGDDIDSEDDRFVNLVYVNDNMYVNGALDGRLFMAFTYDFQDNCFRLTEGLCQTDPEKQLMPPVYSEICDDGSEYYTLGMTVERDRIRCFYNGELIFDFIDAERKYFIADQIESFALFWHTGNYVQISNFSVDRPGYLLEPSYAVGDANGDGSVTLEDVTVTMKRIAKWKNSVVDAYAADADRNGEVSLSDVTVILKNIAEW